MGRATRISRMLAASSLAALALTALVPAAGLAAEEEKPALVLQGGHTAIVRAVAFSRDGRWLVSGSDDSTVKLWEVATGRLVRTFTPGAGDIWGVALDPSGARLASVGDEGPVMIWDTRTGEKIASVKLDGPGARAAFSADARWIAHGTSGKEVKVVDLHSGKLRFTFEGAGTLESAAFSGDGRWLATGSDEHAIMLWDLEVGREKGRFALQDSSISAIAINSDGRWLATASGGWLVDKGRHVRIWDTDTRTVVRELDQQTDAVYGLALSSDGRWVATGDFGGNVRLWDVKSGNKLHDRKEDKGSINRLVFSPDGKSLASASGHLFTSLGAGAARLLDVASWKETQALANFSRTVSAAAMSRSLRWLAYASDDNADGSLKLFDVKARKLRSLKGHIMNVVSVAFSPDERLLASGGQWPDDKVILWNVTTGKAVRALEGHENAVVRLAFNPSGRLLASASYDKTVRIWDVQSGRLVRVLSDFQKGAHSVAFSADGALLATGADDGTITVWNCADWTQRAAFASSPSGVSALVFSPDGRWLAAGGADALSEGGDLRVLNLRDGGEPAILSDRGVYDLAYSPDGRWLVSAGHGTLGVWDVDTNLEARTLSGHTDRVNSIEFAGSGRVLITAGEDGSVRFWDFASGQNTAIMAGASLSDDWVVVTPAGLFDGSSNASHELVAWRFGNGIYPLDRFFNQYYSPGLLKAILDGEQPEPSHTVSALKPPPEVRITSDAPEGATNRQRIAVTVEAEDRGSGVTLVRLYQNNKLIAARPGDSAVVTRKVFAVELLAGENVLRAVALGREGVESNDRELHLTFSGATAARPNLYVLTVGINHYEDPRFDLAFARPDAGAVAQFFEGDDHLFAAKRIRAMFDKDATRENISRAMDEIAAAARAEDVVLVYLAGHGAGVGEQFYFLTRDMRSESDEEAAIRRYGLAASSLGDALLSVKALKQVLILDTCESEAALPILAKALISKARGGLQSEEKAVKMLARSQGIFLIAASTKSQYAFEVPELKHGVLTYALLSGLGENGATPKASATPDGIVTMFSLLQYVNEVVPDLTEKYHNGDKQYPVSANSGQDFPIARSARFTDPDPAQ